MLNVGPMNRQPTKRRLHAIERGVVSGVVPTPSPAAAATLLRKLRELLGLGAGGAGEPGRDQDAAAAAAVDTPQLPAVRGVVRGCYHRASDVERAATGWEASTGRFARERVQSITVTTDPNDPDLHPYAAGGSGASPERGVLCQTAEAYEKLRAGLPESAALLSEERPGSAENLFLEGLTAWELCVGDVFTLAGAGDSDISKGVELQVSSPRRPCEQWNQVYWHNFHASFARLQHFTYIQRSSCTLRMVSFEAPHS